MLTDGLSLRALLPSGGVETIRTAPRSPNCSANAEQCVRSMKDECLGLKMGQYAVQLTEPGGDLVPTRDLLAHHFLFFFRHSA